MKKSHYVWISQMNFQVQTNFITYYKVSAARIHSGFKRALRIIGMVWLVSLLAALPFVFFTKLHYIDRPLNSGNLIPESAFCALLEDRPRVSSTINPLDDPALVIVK